MTEQNQQNDATDRADAEAGPGLEELIHGNPKLAMALGAAIIIIATLLAYIPAIRGGFIWDDDYYVTNNALLRNWEGLQRIWFDVLPRPAEYPLPQYYPMTYTSFWLEYRLWGLNPTGYHIVNVLLHLCNAMLLWLLLKKLEVPGAWLAAAIFALHPINVESVAWIAERKNVLSLLFFLASLYVYLRFAGVIRGRDGALPVKPVPAAEDAEAAAPQIEWFTLPNDPQRLYGLAAVLFLCALFSKTVTSSMPAVALLIIWWKRRGRISLKDDVLPLLPLLVVGALMGMLTAYMERVRVGVEARPQEWDFAATALGEFGARCIIAGKVFWFYIGKLLFPYPLIFNYPRWQIDASNIGQYVYPVLAALLLVLLIVFRKRIGYGIVAAALFYVVTLFPAMGFIDVWPMQYSFVADHFVYIPGIALTALIAAAVARYLTLEVRAGFAAVVTLLFLGMTYAQGRMYEDSETLWKQTLQATDQKSWIAANNYGVILLERGDPGDLPIAEAWFEKVIKLKPNHVEARHNLARIAIRRAQLADAILARAATRPSTQLAAIMPTTRPAEYYEQAIRWYERALDIQPNYINGHYAFGDLLQSLGRLDEAAKQFEETIQLYPRHVNAYLALSDIAMDQGRTKDAIEYALRAAEIDSESARAHSKLGTALLMDGRLQDGLTAWDEALRLAPDDPTYANEFAARMADAGELQKAVAYMERALRIDPTDPRTLTNFGVIAVRAGYPDRARTLFEEALKQDPGFAKARENLLALESGRLRPATTRAATGPTSRP